MTRNHFSYGGVGSNPAVVVLFVPSLFYSIPYYLFSLFSFFPSFSPFSFYSIMSFYSINGSKSGRVVQGARFRYESLRRRGFEPHLLHFAFHLYLSPFDYHQYFPFSILVFPAFSLLCSYPIVFVFPPSTFSLFYPCLSFSSSFIPRLFHYLSPHSLSLLLLFYSLLFPLFRLCFFLISPLEIDNVAEWSKAGS